MSPCINSFIKTIFNLSVSLIQNTDSNVILVVFKETLPLFYLDLLIIIANSLLTELSINKKARTPVIIRNIG
jgi:hypothetical protein